MTQQLPFVHHHTYLASYGSIDDLPFYGKFIIKPLIQLTPLKDCPPQLLQLQRSAPQSNLIIAVSTVLNGHRLQLLLHDSRTDRLVFYREYNNNNGRIEAICEDPQNPNFIFLVSDDGVFGEINLFHASTPQLVVRPIIPSANKKKKGPFRKFTGIAVNATGEVIITSLGSKLFVYDRKTGEQLDTDQGMHQSDITTIKFHPQHHQFLFTSDISGMINVFEISYKKDPMKHSLVWGSRLEDMHVDTIQLRDAAEQFIFFGNDPTNFRYIVAISNTTSALSLIDFNCLDRQSLFEVIQCNFKDMLNEAIVKVGNYDPKLFYLEFSDELAELNLQSNRFEMEERDASEMVASDGLEVLHTDGGMGDGMSDAMSVSVSAASSIAGGDLDNDCVDDEIMSPLPLQNPINSAHLLANVLTPANPDNAGAVEAEVDDPSHPRAWRVTNLLSCYYLPDFASPAAQVAQTPQQMAQIPYQLFISASTSCGGLVTATVSPVNINGKNHITITNLIPSTQPFSAHSQPINDACLLLPSLTTPIYLTGGRDGRIALFHTHASNERIKQQFAAIYNEIQQDNQKAESTRRKNKNRRNNNKKTAGSKTQVNTVTSGLDDAPPASGKVSSGKKNNQRR